MKNGIRRVSLLVAAVLSIVAMPARGLAQPCGGFWPCEEPDPPKKMSREAKYAIDVGANLAIGGLTAAITQRRSGGSFWRGFAQGAAGGGLVFGGKQVSGLRFSGAGALGRQVAAVGTSVVGNAGAGRPALSRVVLPVGPVRVYAEPAALRVRPKVDLAGVLAIGYAATLPGARLDVPSSLSAGAPVFLVSEEWAHRGAHVAGVIVAKGSERHAAGREETIAHERIHVSQYDFVAVAWGEALEERIGARIEAVRPLQRYVDLGTGALLLGTANLVVPTRSKPWEHEAYLLSSRR